jgi:hypothetical protein
MSTAGGRLEFFDPEEVEDMQVRIGKALKLAQNGVYDGDHHKQWVIDQMVRALTGCPMVTKVNKHAVGGPLEYEAQGESGEYLEWVRETCPPGYGSWDEGIAP